MNVDIFQAYSSQNLATSAASAAALVPSYGATLRLFNNSSFPVFVRCGGIGVVATDADIGIPAGGVEKFSVAQLAPPGSFPNQSGVWYIAAISPGGAGILNIQTGAGA